MLMSDLLRSSLGPVMTFLTLLSSLPPSPGRTQAEDTLLEGMPTSRKVAPGGRKAVVKETEIQKPKVPFYIIN